MKDRFDRGILDTQARLHEERESVRRENKMLVDELNTKVCCYENLLIRLLSECILIQKKIYITKIMKVN